MGKNKTQLLEDVKKLLKSQGIEDGIINETIVTLNVKGKKEIQEYLKHNKENAATVSSASAPDPEATPSDLERTEATTTVKAAPTPKAAKKTGDFISACDNCGLHEAGRVKSCPTPGCKGKISILEV